MANKTAEVELSGAEAQIALDYGYPFDEIEKPLAQIAGRRGTFVLELDRFYLEHLAAELSRSSRAVEDPLLHEYLDTLSSVIYGALSVRD